MTAYGSLGAPMPPKIATAYQFATVIVPADNTQIGPYAALWIGEACDLVVCLRNGDGAGGFTTTKFSAVPAGTLLPIAVQGVNATGTTASAGSIIGLG